LKRIKRYGAAIALVAAGGIVLLAGLISANIQASGGLHPVQPYDRWEYAVAVFLVLIALFLILGVVDLMESPARYIDDIDKRDESQDRGATLEVAIGDDEFASNVKR